MPDIELKNISNYVFNGLNMEIFDKELLVVIGPNGAGKSTLLNIIAGLVEYDGNVLFDGVSVNRMLTDKRRVGYLFQNLALFPHLDVASNIGYGPAVNGSTRENIAQRVDELLRLMKIEHLKDRYPKNLSGGERQRVALARALAVSPQVLLLDEPFSSLDSGTCRCIRQEIKRIQRGLGITTVLVTHDMAEAEEMGDRIVAMNDGEVHEVADIQRMYRYDLDDLSHLQNCTSCAIDCYCKE
ncbi:MAG: ABC transporter ATP-binding protein [ANME-2 cluster archaeon]|nr:ABC transporter ATP-binding protein [ANME-2 cluster archaeon]